MGQIPWLVVVGPTASGKSDVSVLVAQAIGGEIVNADASQLYRGMDIGTAKLSVSERGGIPHHMLDVLNVTEEASVAVYQRKVRALGAQIMARGKVPVLVGGSGLYVRAVIDDMSFPPVDSGVRARWEAALAQQGVQALYERLQQADPVAAAAIEPRNGRRIVRALEVIELTGQPFSASMPRREYVHPTHQYGLTAPRAVLDARINARVDRMMSAGLVAEVTRLVPLGLASGKTASRALGYAQVLAYLPGFVPETEVAEQTAQATRRFARRQLSWFGADPRVQWCDGEPDVERWAKQIVADYTYRREGC